MSYRYEISGPKESPTAAAAASAAVAKRGGLSAVVCRSMIFEFNIAPSIRVSFPNGLKYVT